MDTFQVYYSKKILFVLKYLLPVMAIAISFYMIASALDTESGNNLISRIILFTLSFISLVVVFFTSRPFFNKEINSTKFVVHEDYFIHYFNGHERKVSWSEIAFYTWMPKFQYLIELKSGHIILFDGQMQNASKFIVRMKVRGIRKQ